MAWGFVKSTQGSQGSNTSFALTVTAVPVNCLVVFSAKFTAAVSAITVTDNASTPNTYAQAGTLAGSGSNYETMFYGVAVTGGATQITISWTTSASTRCTADVFSGGMLTNAAVFDTTAQATGSSTSSAVALSPAANGELIVMGVALGAGATSPVVGSNYIFGTNGNAQSTEYRAIGTTSETAPLSWTTSVAWAEVAAAFIPRPNADSFLGMFN